MDNIRNKDSDPLKGQVLDVEIKQREQELLTDFQSAMYDTSAGEKIVVLKQIQFEGTSSNLSGASQFEIENLVSILKKYPNTRIEIGGHTDNTGDQASNMQISRDRANAVYQELIKKGIEASRMTAVGYGPSKPTATNDTPEGRAQNNRTEIKIQVQ
jgi:outer membrane protein OmpA-like peptidoglycan-associated protein